MASYSQKVIFIALILTIAVPSSTSRRENWERSEDTNDMEQYLRDLCSETDKPNACWNMMKSELSRFDDVEDEDVADMMIDLAIAKAKDIQDKLKRWYKDSNDDKMKKKYHSCSKNYKDVAHKLEKAKKNLDSDDYHKISDKMEDAKKKLDKCVKEFESDSFDRGHVEERNDELVIYLDMVRAAMADLQDYYNEDRN